MARLETGRRTGGGRPALMLLWAAAAIGWSLLAWLGYSLADPLLAWLGATLPGVAESGGELATVFGGKEAGAAVDALGAGPIAAQGLGLLAIVLKPAIVVVWVLGLAALAVLATLVAGAGRLGRRLLR